MLRGSWRAVLTAALLVAAAPLSQHPAAADRNSARTSYLRNFMTMRRHIFPLSTDLKITRVSSVPPQGPTVVINSNNNNNDNNNLGLSIRQIRNYGSSPNQYPSIRRNAVVQNAQLPDVKNAVNLHQNVVGYDENNQVTGRKIEVNSLNAVRQQYTNYNHLNTPTTIQDAELFDRRRVAAVHSYPTQSLPSQMTTQNQLSSNTLRYVTTADILEMLRSTHPNYTNTHDKESNKVSTVTSKKPIPVTERPTRVTHNSLFETVLASLRNIPVLGKTLICNMSVNTTLPTYYITINCSRKYSVKK